MKLANSSFGGKLVFISTFAENLNVREEERTWSGLGEAENRHDREQERTSDDGDPLHARAHGAERVNLRDPSISDWHEEAGISEVYPRIE